MQPKQPLEFYSEALPDVDTAELQGTLIVIEGPDAVGRSTQVARLRMWLERQGHAVLDTGFAPGALPAKGIQGPKKKKNPGPRGHPPGRGPAVDRESGGIRPGAARRVLLESRRTRSGYASSPGPRRLRLLG